MGKFVQYTEKLGKNILYTPCNYVPLEEITSYKIQKLITLMTRKMRGDGIGLAANQVGAHLQIFLIEFFSSKDEPYFDNVPLQVFINPRITNASSDKVTFWHGCLSAKGHDLGEVATYSWIDYEAYNEKGKKIVGRLDKMAAVIFQHEFRHMLGSCYLDHATRFLSSKDFADKSSRGEEANYKKADFGVPLLLVDYKIGESIEDYSIRRKL